MLVCKHVDQGLNIDYICESKQYIDEETKQEAASAALIFKG